MKTLVLGLGNPLLRDDSVGLRVVEKLRGELDGIEHIDIDLDYWGGLRLMERMIGYDRAIIIDAICTGGEPGTLHLLSPDDIPTQRSTSAHDVNLPTALELGRQVGAKLPESDDILLIGIEAQDVLTFAENLTPDVEAAIPQAVSAVLTSLRLEREAL
jgi:hydrogenase maturation protease